VRLSSFSFDFLSGVEYRLNKTPAKGYVARLRRLIADQHDENGFGTIIDEDVKAKRLTLRFLFASTLVECQDAEELQKTETSRGFAIIRMF
jgi:hypothetical protein